MNMLHHVLQRNLETILFRFILNELSHSPTILRRDISEQGTRTTTSQKKTIKTYDVAAIVKNPYDDYISL